MRIIKRSGREVDFDAKKIYRAISAANNSVAADLRLTETELKAITQKVENACFEANREISVEDIQDMVEDALIRFQATEVARSYIRYRRDRELVRKANTTDEQILSLIDDANEDMKQENSNKNPTLASTQRDYMAGAVSRDLTERLLLPKDIVDAHKQGIIHFHDSDFFAQHIHNCCLINLEDMLQNGTVISETKIEKPHSFSTACNITTQIIAQVACSQYGGCTFSLAHLAPFIDISRKKITEDLTEEMRLCGNTQMSDETFSQIVERRVRKEINRGVQMLQYQILTLLTTNGQAPFVSMFMYLNEAKNTQEKQDLAIAIEEVLQQRIKGVKNEQGVWITPAFPKLLYVLEDDNVRPDTTYWYLTQLAAKCTAKRMVPDYISEKIMLRDKISPKSGKGEVYGCMGCRSFLTPDRTPSNLANALNYDAEHGKYYGRFNQGVVTINLPDVALSARNEAGGQTEDAVLREFWNLLDDRLELCHKALRCRHDRLLGTRSDIAPLLWQYGALARLQKGETIHKLLYDGYSTLSLGYAGLWECVYGLIGKKLTEPEGKELGLQIMHRLNEYTAKWKAAENIDYSLYGTPLESTTYKFAKCLKKRFGVVNGVTDKNYITNSYHIHVTEPIDAFDKLTLESEFQVLSPGGAISYIEVPNMQQNLDAVLTVIRFIYDHIMYAELNTKSDYCQVCGYNGEIQIVEKDNKLIWQCPACGNTDQSKMNVARRTCGYIGTQFWNQGRTQEIKDRVLHL